MMALPPLSLLQCPDTQSSQVANVDVGVKCFVLVMAAGGGKRGGRTQQSAKRVMHSKDASNRGNATGNDKPVQQKDERAAQQ
jgi:hypothetical protein